jgi:hypothetical protein
MAIATFASIDKLFIVFPDYSWSCSFVVSSESPARALSLVGIAVSQVFAGRIASIQKTKVCLVFLFIGSNLGALADVRALTDNRGWSQADFAYCAIIDRSYMGVVKGMGSNRKTRSVLTF